MSKVMIRALVVAFVLVDVALGVLAWRHVYGDSAPAADIRPATSATAPAETPKAPTGWAALDPAASSILDGSADGIVALATAGACDGAAAALIVSTNGGAAFKPVEPAVQRILAVDVRPDGTIALVGADEECTVVGLSSADDGATWDEAPVGDGWYRDPAKPAAVVVRGSSVDVGCPVIALSGVSADVASVTCADGTLRRTDDAGKTWTASETISAVRAVSFVSSTNGTALAQTEKCAAAAFTTANGGETWSERGCVTGAIAGAVADLGSVIRAWVDAKVWSSADGGATWTAPEAQPTDDPSADPSASPSASPSAEPSPSAAPEDEDEE